MQENVSKMKEYNHKEIEKKWQDEWEKNQIYKTEISSALPKKYILDMFPYPSGEGLHVGHPRGYIATDIYSRMKRMQGFSVLHPMGWDAFGLPAENFAIKNKVHPRIAVEQNVARFKEQLSIIGLDYDWSKEVNTTDPAFYKWTQWIFLKMYEKGLAYESNEPINWCPSCQTGLANEDVESDSTCERCGTKVEKKPLRQWVLRITDYADRMLADLDKLPKWPEGVKEAQRHWIGKSQGAEIDFAVNGQEHKIKIFTTRPDTIFGATFIAVSAGLAKKWIDIGWSVDETIKKYIEDTLKEQETRDFKEKEKTGIFAGFKAVNPATKEEIPVWITNYVLNDIGTGAIMGVPAHDERDFDFARKFNLSILRVIDDGGDKGNVPSEYRDNPSDYLKNIARADDFCFTGEGSLINSGDFDGMDSKEARQKITEFVGGKTTKTYRIKDWVFSRQRYWGEPIPIIHCEKCGVVPVPEKDLPVLLPEVKNYAPSGTGESPLADISEWVNVECPKCGDKAKRETNTMPQWAGSSWYYLRYLDTENSLSLVDKDKEKKWMPVDVYVGGDHATRHLIYARFWHKFLFDIGVVSTEEPFPRLEFLGFILAEDGSKMSKSNPGGVISPDEIVERFGADAFRLYEMFIGPFEYTAKWSTNGMVGAVRFLEKVWRAKDKVVDFPSKDNSVLHKTIKKVGEDIENFKFNTAVSNMMICVNEMESVFAQGSGVMKEDYKKFLQILAPFAPHITEELWYELGETESIHLSAWPKYDESKIIDDEVIIGVQINGKVRGEIKISKDTEEAGALEMALKNESVSKWIDGKEIKKVIYVAGRILNIIV